jgi:hypothetical protein
MFINQGTKRSRYPVKIIMEAIGHDNLGYSARETVRYLTRQSALRARRATAHDSMRGSMSPIPSL